MADAIIERLRASSSIPVKRLRYPHSRYIGACEGCRAFKVPVTRHHLVPKSVEGKWARVARSQSPVTRDPVKLTVWLCDPCHVLIHQRFTNEQLAEMPRDRQLEVLGGGR
jgi:hypothetical protein